MPQLKLEKDLGSLQEEMAKTEELQAREKEPWPSGRQVLGAMGSHTEAG